MRRTVNNASPPSRARLRHPDDVLDCDRALFTPPTAINILLIGNNFTQRNDLPGMLAAMAAEHGVRIRHKLISAGGASLRAHWNAGQGTAIGSGK